MQGGTRRIPAWQGLEGPSVGHPVQPPAEAGSPRANTRVQLPNCADASSSSRGGCVMPKVAVPPILGKPTSPVPTLKALSCRCPLTPVLGKVTGPVSVT